MQLISEGLGKCRFAGSWDILNQPKASRDIQSAIQVVKAFGLGYLIQDSKAVEQAGIHNIHYCCIGPQASH